MKINYCSENHRWTRMLESVSHTENCQATRHCLKTATIVVSHLVYAHSPPASKSLWPYAKHSPLHLPLHKSKTGV